MQKKIISPSRHSLTHRHNIVRTVQYTTMRREDYMKRFLDILTQHHSAFRGILSARVGVGAGFPKHENILSRHDVQSLCISHSNILKTIHPHTSQYLSCEASRLICEI